MQSVKEGRRQKSLSNVLESWHEAEKQLAIIIDKWPYASHVARKKEVGAARLSSWISLANQPKHPSLLGQQVVNWF